MLYVISYFTFLEATGIESTTNFLASSGIESTSISSESHNFVGAFRGSIKYIIHHPLEIE